MIQELILASLCAAGFITSWNSTNIKAHVLGVCFPSLRNKPVEQVEDELHLRFGTFGELLNCPYCFSSWVGLALFSLFYFTAPSISVFVSAFLIPPAIIHALGVFSPEPMSEEQPDASIAEEPSGENLIDPFAKAVQVPASDYKVGSQGGAYRFTAPFDVQKRILAIKDDPKKHRENLIRNSLLLGLLNQPDSCPDQACRDISDAYKKELKHMESAYKKDPQKCPKCTRGSIVNKYFFMLYDIMGEQEVSFANPKTQTKEQLDAESYTTEPEAEFELEDTKLPTED